MRVLVEWLLKQKKRVVILTPKDDWWGLKSAADGKQEGFPIVIFGGKHQDLPFNARAGTEVAELICAGNRPCLITFARQPPTDRTRFYNDFMAGLFKHHQGELFVVIDEVHNFAPKGKVFSPDAGMMIHWSNTLASEGQGQGLIMIAASQRPQKVHNDLLTSCETLIACRVIHKADRDADKDWIDGCADPEIGKSMLADLANMEREDAWCWSPEIGFGPKRITWPMFETYDSFKPQKAGDAKKLKGWADVDLAEVKAKLTLVVEEAKANDPKELRARIAELERQIKATPGPISRAMDADRKEEAIARADAAGYDRGWQECWKANFEERKKLHVALAATVKQMFEGSILALPPRKPAKQATILDRIKNATSGGDWTPGQVAAAAASERLFKVTPEIKVHTHPSGGVTMTAVDDFGEIPKGEALILTALIQYSSSGLTRDELTMIAGYKRSTRDEYINRLTKKGYVEVASNGTVTVTAAGKAALPNAKPLPTGAALQEVVMQRLQKGEREILTFVINSHPKEVNRETLTEATGFKRSTRDEYLNRLKKRRLVEFPSAGQVAAAPMLF